MLTTTRAAPHEVTAGRGVLPRYLVVAVLVRLADEGTRVALVLLALARAHSPAFGGALVAAFMIPHVVAAPAIGALADRVRQRKLLYAGSLAAYAAALAGCAALAGRVPGVVVLAVAVAGGCSAPLVTGGLTGLLRDFVPRSGRGRAYSLDAVTYNVAGICGPAVAALTAGWLGAGAATLACAGSACAGVAVLATVPIGAARRDGPPAQPPPIGEPAAGEPAADPRLAARGTSRREVVLAGVAALARERTLRAVTVATSVGMLGVGALPLVGALLAARYHAGWAAGGLLSAAAVGGLVGSLAYARYPIGAGRPQRVVMVGLIGAGLPLLLVPVAHDVRAALLLFAASGLFSGPQASALFVCRDRHAPAYAHTQVFTLGAGLKITAAALGAASAGLVSGVGPAWLISGVAAAQLLGGAGGAAMLAGVRPRARGADRPG